MFATTIQMKDPKSKMPQMPGKWKSETPKCVQIPRKWEITPKCYEYQGNEMLSLQTLQMAGKTTWPWKQE